MQWPKGIPFVNRESSLQSGKLSDRQTKRKIKVGKVWNTELRGDQIKLKSHDILLATF